MIRRAAPFLASLLLVLAACAHAPARPESAEVPAPPPPEPAPAASAAAPEAAPAPEAASVPEPAPPEQAAATEPAPVRPVQTLELRLVKTFPGAVAPKSVALSPDGRWAAVMNLEGMDVWLIDTGTLEIVRRIDFAPYREAASGWDYARKKPIPSFAQKPVEAAFSADSRHLWFSLHNAASVVVYDLEEQEEIPASARSSRSRPSSRAPRPGSSLAAWRCRPTRPPSTWPTWAVGPSAPST